MAASTEVWCKHLADGKSVAVALVNLGDVAADITATWAMLGLSRKIPPSW